MKAAVKKMALGPVMAWNRLFFSAYFRLTRRRYRLAPLEELRGKRILVIAPHVDDEVLGCGGLLGRLASGKNRVQCLYLTNGAGSYHPRLGRKKLIKLREEEGRRVAAFYGLEPPSFLGMEDGAVELTPGAVEAVEAELHRLAPQLVLLPFFLDGHKDHYMATRLGLAALQKGGFGGDFPLYLYQSGSAFTPGEANSYLPLGERELAGKKRALSLFQSQTMPFSGLLLLDTCRRWVLKGERDGVQAVEFFWSGSLEDCSAALESCEAGSYQRFRPCSSPYFLIRDYFSGWSFKKKAGRRLAGAGRRKK